MAGCGEFSEADRKRMEEAGAKQEFQAGVRFLKGRQGAVDASRPFRDTGLHGGRRVRARPRPASRWRAQTPPCRAGDP